MGVNCLMKNFTNQEYWNQYWDKEVREEINFYFADLLEQYIQWEKVNPKSYMEIGGAPGNIMAYMRQHQLSTSTVDFTESQRIEKFLKKQQVNNYHIYQEDFQNFDIKEHMGKWGIVASWGFLEHFEKKITSDFIKKQKQMVSNDGYLIIELPNIRKLMWLIYWIFNRQIIKIHNLEIMDLDYLKEEILKTGDFELIYASYYFAMNRQNDYFLGHKNLKKICEKIVYFFTMHDFSMRVKRWFFPYIVLIAKRN